MNEPHLTLRQVQRERFMVSLPKHKFRGKELKFLNSRISPQELRTLQGVVAEHQGSFLEAWNGHFGGRRR